MKTEEVHIFPNPDAMGFKIPGLGGLRSGSRIELYLIVTDDPEHHGKQRQINVQLKPQEFLRLLEIGLKVVQLQPTLPGLPGL